MITPDIRRASLTNFPIGTPFLIAAREPGWYADIVRERNDPAVTLCTLADLDTGGRIRDANAPHVFIEGLDGLARPSDFLRSVRERTPQARIFALISNAAHLMSLAAFYAGTPLAFEHPLVLEEIAQIFTDAGWTPLAVKSIVDPALPDTAPVEITAGAISFRIVAPQMLERARTAAYLVIADAT